MGLRKLTSALLPAAYREQILGDLQERGFRAADVTSVLPGVWWSHLRRSSFVPNLAGASEEVIERRTQHLKNWRAGWALLWTAIYAISKFLDASRTPGERWTWLVILLFVLVVVAAKEIFVPAQSAANAHRRQLSQMRDFARIGSPYFLAVFATSRVVQTYSGEPVADGLYLVGMVCCLMFGRIRPPHAKGAGHPRMSRHSLISSLLPAEYRQQVLGDLQERGFRPRDAASVLPRVWWSCLCRCFRVPMLTGAPEAKLRDRAQRF